MKVVIFCGGFGTRMWPVGRKSFPKQFYPVVKGKSFFQITYQRFKNGFDPKDILVSTEGQYEHFIHEQAPEIPKSNIIVEPERRDSLGAIGLVSAVVNKRFGNEVMFFSWSDHFIKDEAKFIKIVKAALGYTEKTGIPVSVNEEPTFPSVHNGWLEQGRKVDTVHGYSLHQILRFIEKPKYQTALKYLKEKNYYIHTGYGAWRADKMLEYFKEFRPNEYYGLMKIHDATGTPKYESVLNEVYPKFEKTSVEIGLFEKLPKDLRLNIPMSVGWEDAGTWQLYYNAMLEKGENSVIEGESYVLQIGSSKNLVVSDNPKKAIVILGLKNVVVVDTKDGLLVSDIDSTQKVKDVFKNLERHRSEFIK